MIRSESYLVSNQQMNFFRRHTFFNINKKDVPVAPLVVLLFVFLLVQWTTQSDYGITWDSGIGELYLGDKYLRFYATGDLDYLDPKKDNIELYDRPDHPDFYRDGNSYSRHKAYELSGFSHTVSALTKHVFYTLTGILDPIDAHYIAITLFMIVLSVAIYFSIYPLYGGYAAITSLLFLICHPRFYMHLHTNLKDVGVACMIGVTILMFRHAILKRHPWKIIACAVVAGLALATKANALFIAPIVLPWFLYVLYQRRSEAQKPVLRLGELMALLVFPLVVAVVWVLAWPIMLDDFPSNIVKYFSWLIDQGVGGPDHWNSRPFELVLFATPIAFHIAFLSGVIVLVFQQFKTRRNLEFVILIFFWLLIPILRVSVPTAKDFNGIRHWLAYLPAYSMIAGIGVSAVIRWIGRFKIGRNHFIAVMLVAVLILPTVYWNVTRHPFQVVYYSPLIGRIKGAMAAKRGDSSTDYWGSSYRQGYKWINDQVEQGAIITSGVAPHLVRLMAKTRLRDDLSYMDFPQVIELLKKHKLENPCYVMYVRIPSRIRKMPYLEKLDQLLDPSYEIVVDGVPILTVLKLELNEEQYTSVFD